MSTLNAFRTELRALVGPRAFLHRDRTGRALFVCRPAQQTSPDTCIPAKLQAAGYLVNSENDLWYIDLNPERRIQWLDSLSSQQPPEEPHLRSLCRSLLSQGNVPSELQPWPLLRQTLLDADAGAWERLYQTLSAEIAVLKRTGAPLPGSAATVIAYDYADWREKHVDLASWTQ